MTPARGGPEAGVKEGTMAVTRRKRLGPFRVKFVLIL